MIYIGFHLHAYQPPTQLKDVLQKIHSESYEPIIRLLEENPNIFISLDVAKSLAERWPPEFLSRIARLYYQRKICLVNTAAYHYLLPLFSEKTILRQLNLNYEFYRDKFGIDGPTLGLFPPELAFSPKMAAIAVKTGVKWLMADDEPFIYQRMHLPEIKRSPQNWIPTIFGCGVILRSRFWSDRISRGYFENGAYFARELLSNQKKWEKELNNNGDSYIILAVDFETFGHHLRDSIDKFLIPFFNEIKMMNQDIEPVFLDFIFNHFPKIPASEYLPEGSWSTSQEDLKQHVPFPLWLHPGNEFHKLWHDFVCYTYIASEECQNPELIDLLDQAFYSCTPWQYSQGNKKIASWCLPMFEKIANLLEISGSTRKMSELKMTLRDFKSFLV